MTSIVANTFNMIDPLAFNYRNNHPVKHGQDDGFHSHPFYELYYFHEGKCTYVIGDKIYTLVPGDLILMHGMTLHRPHPDPSVPYVRTTLHFYPTMLEEYLVAERAHALLAPFEKLKNHVFHLTAEQQQETETSLAQLNQLYEMKGREQMSDRFVLKLCDFLIMAQQFTDNKLLEQRTRTDKEEHIQGIITYLETNYMNEIGLEEIARELHLSKPYMAALFKEMTGTTIFKYLYMRRINQAKLLFRFHPDMSVTEASKKSGFKRVSHFSRMFKQTVGCTPEVFRTHHLI
ncbi:AraC family transcriptional regulator [Paenibacillus urinalis]|uniref:AraC family transcriptional regulator n=1 Tax=Paenibacillus urinalis TaxID=521520 RepID=A0AAX3N4W5_9BACL|nr:AraC family transcriptional regulator [Paenibacillus urinalis]WDH84617.1 AraC family transcriptional regulator [Paenibacillus urinalis]